MQSALQGPEIMGNAGQLHPLLWTPSNNTSNTSAHNVTVINPEIEVRSALRANEWPLNVVLKPAILGIGQNICRLKTEENKVLATMRTSNTGYKDIAVLMPTQIAFLVTNIITVLKGTGSMSEAIKKIQESASRSETKLKQHREVLKKFAIKLFAVFSVSTSASFMVNMALQIRNCRYEFIDDKNQLQLTARRQRDRKSILIEYTKLKGRPLIGLTYIMKLNKDYTAWELYLQEKEENGPLLTLPVSWQRDTQFATLDGNFAFKVKSMSRYGFRFANTRFIAPLTTGSEIFEIQFRRITDVPRDVLAFCCYIARTIDTMPLDLLVIMFLIVLSFGTLLGFVVHSSNNKFRELVDFKEET